MMAPRRKPIPMKVKLAAALLTIVHQDEHGNWVPVIGHEEARMLTADQIIARFHFDHGVYAAFGGAAEPWNLTPMAVEDHREKTKRDVKEIARVRRGLKRRAGAGKPKRLMQYTALRGKFKRRMDGKTVERTP